MMNVSNSFNLFDFLIHNCPSKLILFSVHFSPSGNGQWIASDVTVYPNASHVQQPRIPYPGPPPGDKNVFLFFTHEHICRLIF